MNTSHRILWNAVRQAFVVAPENAASRGKPASSPRLAAALSLGLLAASPAAQAQACPSSADGSPITQVSSQCQGDIVNTGHIQSDREGIEISQGGVNPDQDGDGRVDDGFLSQSQVRGDVINTGRVESEYEALFIADSMIHGSVRNDGELISRQDEGIYVAGAQIHGAVENNGRIHALTDDAVYIRGNDDIVARIDGGIVNRGRLEAGDGNGLRVRHAVIGASIRNEAGGLIVSLGDSIRVEDGSVLNGDLVNHGGLQSQDGDGIEVAESVVNGAVRNDGEIKAGDDGMFIAAATLQRMENHGSIDAGSSGMLLGEETQLADGLHNTGAIRGESNAIRLRGAQVEQGLFNSGSLQGGRYAILATDYVRDDGTVLANRLENIVFDTRADDVVSGDILAAGSALTLVSGATLQQRNAIKVKQLNIEAGATLQANAGASLAQEPDLIGDGIHAGQLRNAGTLAIAAGEQAALHGDYLQTATGELRVGVADDSRYGKLRVTGKAELPSQARIAVDVADPSFRFSARALQGVLQAGELVSDGSFAVSDNSLLFDFGAAKNGNQVDLTVQGTRRAARSVLGQARLHALPAAQALDEALARQPVGELASRFVALSGERQVADAVAQTLPLFAGQSQQAAWYATDRTRLAVRDRLQAAFAPDEPGAQAWIKPFRGEARQFDRDGIDGFDLDSKGFVVGADGELGRARLGLGLAYARSGQDGGAAPHKLDVDSYQLIAYGRQALGERAALSFQADLGQHRHQGSRSLPFANSHATARYRSYSAHLGLALERAHAWGDSRLVPSLSVDYSRLRDGAYQEQGAGPLNLNVAARNAAKLELAADLRFGHAFSQRLTLSGRVGGVYDALNQQASVAAEYAGAPGAAFTTRGMAQTPWSLRGGLGLDYQAGKHSELSVRYDAEGRGGFRSQGASLQLLHRF